MAPQVPTASRPEGELEASCKIGSSHAISTASARPWAVGLKMAFVQGGAVGREGSTVLSPGAKAGIATLMFAAIAHRCAVESGSLTFTLNI